MKTRKAYINKFKSYLGTNAKTIIDIYNSIQPLPAGYKLTVGKDGWCAATVSAVAYTLGYQDIIPLECSCGRMIQKAQEMGIWVENDAYVPQTGDIIMYDWQDSGKGDCTGWPDHVGAVVSVDGFGNMVIIEGNHNNTVKTRNLRVNDRYIRGYITPKYDTPTEETEPTITDEPIPITEKDDEMVYETFNDLPNDYKPEIQILIDKGVFASRTPDGAVRIGLTESAIRSMVLMVRYIKKLKVTSTSTTTTTSTIE